MKDLMVETLLWVWIILDSGMRASALPDITDESFISECVDEHNKARSSVSPPASNMLYMSWGDALAITAKASAKRCIFQHDRHNPRVGENIWTGYPPSQFNVRSAVEMWVNETYDYDYKANSCKGICGHYRQVVWATSYNVGCAAQLCPDGVADFSTQEGVVFVCHYAEVNMDSMPPYESGDACSECQGSCEKKLCRSPEQERMRIDKRTADTAAWAGRPSYVSILIVRPVALFFTFITAYAVHKLHPSVFCYE